MQYGLDVSTYKRKKKIEVEKKKNNVQLLARVAIIFLSSLLISRVRFINNTAPFGIALYMIAFINLDLRESFYSALGVILGYFTIISQIDYMPVYILIVGILYTIDYFKSGISRDKKFIYSVVLISSALMINYVIFLGMDIMVIVNVILNLLCIVPIYFILNKSLISYRSIFSKLFFSTEEIISSGILIALAIAGMKGIVIANISLMNIFALFIVIGMSYICGPAFGTVIGVSIGIICGMSDANMTIYITIYSVVALSVGIVRESSKWITGMIGLFVYFILILYHQEQSVFIGIEACLALIAFLVIPNKSYMSINKRVVLNNVQEIKDQKYMERSKEIYSEKISKFSGLLYDISGAMNEYIDNERLELRYKSSGLVQNLADRVCFNCNLNSVCWKREMHYTYSDLSQIIEGVENDSIEVPERINRKCMKKEELYQNAHDLIDRFNINEMKKNSFQEGRKIIADQINSMANSMERIIKELDLDKIIDIKKEEQIKNILISKSINFNDVECFENSKGKKNVKIKLESCGGCNKCNKNIQPLIEKIYNKKMQKVTEGCCINSIDGSCIVEFEEMPKYHISTFKLQKSKEEESENGDGCVDFKLPTGEYMSIISDGMGSGPSAARESDSIIKLIKKFSEAGFDKIASLNAINSVMSMKYKECEKFSTVDLNTIDLYSGNMEFVKVGAVESFIKKNNGAVEVVEASSLPIGVLDKVDLETYNYDLEDGDIVVMISDGILDYSDESAGSARWVVNYLRKEESFNPKEIANGIMQEALNFTDNKVRDDMTVLVSRVHKIN